MGSSSPTSWRASPAGTRGLRPPCRLGVRSCTTTTRVIGDPRSTWGRLEANPDAGAYPRTTARSLPVDFLVNVTQNRRREITGFSAATRRGARAPGSVVAAATAMVACARPFPMVVTTNSGLPLDQNLYQTVKGSAGADRRRGRLLATAAECDDGFPEHGNFKRLLFDHGGPGSCSTRSRRRAFRCSTSGRRSSSRSGSKARVGLRSELPEDEVRRAHLEPIADVGGGGGARAAAARRRRRRSPCCRRAADDPIRGLKERRHDQKAARRAGAG